MLGSPSLKLLDGGDQVGASAAYAVESELSRRSEMREPRLIDASNISAYVSNDNVDEIDALSSSAKSLIRSYASALPTSMHEGLMRQTIMLFKDLSDSDEELPPSLDSFRTMLRAIVQLKPLDRPNLGLSDNGNVLAVWRSDEAQGTVEFQANDRIRWTIRTMVNGQRNSIAGMTGVREIRNMFVALGAGCLLNG